MENPYEPPRSQVGVEELGPLLPRWIRVFSWIFFVLGPLAVGVFVTALFSTAGPMSVEFLGIRHVGPPTDPEHLVALSVLIVFGITAFGLLWERPWGLAAGLLCGFGGLAIVAVNLVLSWRAGNTIVPFEPVFQVPFVISLLRRRNEWRSRVQRTAARRSLGLSETG